MYVSYGNMMIALHLCLLSYGYYKNVMKKIFISQLHKLVKVNNVHSKLSLIYGSKRLLVGRLDSLHRRIEESVIICIHSGAEMVIGVYGGLVCLCSDIPL